MFKRNTSLYEKWRIKGNNSRQLTPIIAHRLGAMDIYNKNRGLGGHPKNLLLLTEKP